jgi:hypothetical protein
LSEHADAQVQGHLGIWETTMLQLRNPSQGVAPAMPRNPAGNIHVFRSLASRFLKTTILRHNQSRNLLKAGNLPQTPGRGVE